MVCLKKRVRRSLVLQIPQTIIPKNYSPEEICRKASAVHVSLSHIQLSKNR